MSIEVMIQRRIQQGPQARKLVPLILQLRALAWGPCCILRWIITSMDMISLPIGKFYGLY